MKIEKYKDMISEKSQYTWKLPPSKSHLQRALLLSSVMSEKVRLENINSLGNDSLTMIQCLEKLGSNIKYNAEKEIIFLGENKKKKLHAPNTILDCKNSATTLKLLIGFCSRFKKSVTFDGDHTLQRRPIGDLLENLESAGAIINSHSENSDLPVTIKGPINSSSFLIDVTKSSQSLSSLVISGVNSEKAFKIKTKGMPASKNHSDLTIRMAKQTGANISLISTNELFVEPWNPKWDGNVKVPGDASLAIYCMLWSRLQNVSIILQGFPNKIESLGHNHLIEISEYVGLDVDTMNDGKKFLTPFRCKKEPILVDLKNSIDALPAMAALLAVTCGGTLTGIENAKIKESDRINETQKLLSIFGIKTDLIGNDLVICGNQLISKPKDNVPIPYDHRINMLAIILASAEGGTLEFSDSYEITDKEFVNRLSEMGLKISYI